MRKTITLKEDKKMNNIKVLINEYQFEDLVNREF